MNQELDQLSNFLKRILHAELAAGNSVSGLTVDWPRPGKLCVYVEHRFKVKHDIEGTSVQYGEDHDPHGPVAEYCDRETEQSLICSLQPER